MPTSVRLDAKTEALVHRLAYDREISKSEVIREAIVAYVEPRDGRGETSVYDRVKHLIGRHPSGRTDLSQDTGEKVYQMLRQRHEQEQAKPGRRR